MYYNLLFFSHDIRVYCYSLFKSILHVCCYSYSKCYAEYVTMSVHTLLSHVLTIISDPGSLHATLKIIQHYLPWPSHTSFSFQLVHCSSFLFSWCTHRLWIRCLMLVTSSQLLSFPIHLHYTFLSVHNILIIISFPKHPHWAFICQQYPREWLFKKKILLITTSFKVHVT